MSQTVKAVTIAATTAVIGGVVGTLVLSGTFTTENPVDAGVVVGPGQSDAGAPPPPPPPPPPPSSANHVGITLHPLATGTRWVTFGLPLPPGALTDTTQVKVTKVGAAEIPAYVRSLGNWRRVPPAELLCTTQPGIPGIRSVQIQFQYNFATLADVPITVDLETAGQRLSAGTDVRATYRVFNDDGELYNGTEGFKEPTTYAVIDHKWLACAGLGVMAGQSDVTPQLAPMDVAERNFFYTSIASYRSAWTSPTADWPVNPGNGPDLANAEDGVWLYQRAQNFWGAYMRNGLFQELRSGFQAFDHYRSLIYNGTDCAGVAAPQWCLGFFKLKNPDRTTPYKDPKYSYAEDFATYYWLTGDDTVLPYFTWIAAAEKIGVPNQGWTERFATYQLMGHMVQYEVTGDANAKNEAKLVVDGLVTKSTKASSDGHVSGCWIGNNEWGPDGFSPWMGPMLMTQLVHYYSLTGDNRVPPMLVRVADCIRVRGMAVSDGTGGAELTGMTIPFYGARTVGPVVDVDGGFPLAGVEHATNVSQGLAIGYMYSTDSAQKAALKSAIDKLIIAANWDFLHWTRTTAGLPKFRLTPYRKGNWWFRSTGQLQWALYGKPVL